MRVLCSAVLALEAVVIGLAAVAASGLGDRAHALAPAGAGIVVAALLAALALLGHAAGYVLGSAVQVAVLAAGVVVPVMFFLGALFAVLWVTAIALPRRAERVRAARAAAASTGAAAAGGDS